MKRKSNIELLRIMAFLMVIVIHVTPTGLVIPNGIESHSYSWYYASLMRCLANPAITIFLMISGYVSYYKKDNFNVKKTLIRLLIPLFVLAPILCLINILETGFSSQTFKTLLDTSVSLTGSFHHLWYIVGYFLIVILAPVLLKGIEKITKKEFLLMLITMYIFTGVTELISLIIGKILFCGMFSNNIVYFLIVFMTGIYINKYDIKVKKIISFIIVICFMYINYKIFLVNNPINSNLQLLTIANNFQIFNILQTIYIFLFFKELKIQSKIINNIAKLTYGAYIVHVFFIYYLQRIVPFIPYLNNFNYFLYDLRFIFCVAICSLLTEAIRQLLFMIYKKAFSRKTKTSE